MIYANIFTNQNNKQFQMRDQAGLCSQGGAVGTQTGRVANPTEEHSARTGVNIGPQERAPPGFGTSLFISVLHQQREKFLTPALPVTVTPFRSLRSSSTL